MDRVQLPQGYRTTTRRQFTSFFLSIYYTCYSLVKLFRHLLSTSHKYSCLGKFATDILEKELTVNNTRALVVLACFISVQQVIEKVQIKQSSWLLLIDMK